MTTNASFQAQIEAFASEKGIKIVTPSAGSDFDDARKAYVRQNEVPLAVAQPRTDREVADVVAFCRSSGVPISVRGGGHDHQGRGVVPGTVCIDLRGICHVEVSTFKGQLAAKVGGGANALQVVDALADHDLITATGLVATVGYCGWATIAGYGPLSNNFGLGVDQILGARVVDARGNIFDADEELLGGLRGGGPGLAIVVELTIKAYPLKGGSVVGGMIIYESSNLEDTLQKWFENYNLLKDSLPQALGITPIVVPVPGVGRALGSPFVWSSDDHEEGMKWVDRIAAFAPCLMKQVGPTRLGEVLKANETLIPTHAYGRSNAVSVYGFSSKLAKMLAKHANELPPGGPFLGSHILRGPSTEKTDSSVFGPRMPHVVLELVSVTAEKEHVPQSLAWSTAFKQDLLQQLPGEITGAGFPPLLPREEVDWQEVFGDNYGKMKALKAKYDPEDVFGHFITGLV